MLLREARKPRLAKRKLEQTEEEKDKDDEDSDKDVQKGWTVKRWTQIPAHLEETEREYLAKRRRGTANAVQAAAITPAVPTRKAKVRKLDAEGNATVYEVIVPEGQPVSYTHLTLPTKRIV